MRKCKFYKVIISPFRRCVLRKNKIVRIVQGGQYFKERDAIFTFRASHWWRFFFFLIRTLMTNFNIIRWMLFTYNSTYTSLQRPHVKWDGIFHGECLLFITQLTLHHKDLTSSGMRFFADSRSIFSWREF